MAQVIEPASKEHRCSNCNCLFSYGFKDQKRKFPAPSLCQVDCPECRFECNVTGILHRHNVW